MSRNMYPDANLVTVPYDGSIQVDLNDLVFLDTDDAKPASSQADAGSKSANQAAFAPRFLGVASERKLSDAASGDLDVATEWVGEMPCVSNTFEPGDLVTVAENAGGTALEDQKLEKCTTVADAIGHVRRHYGSAVTTIEVVLRSRVFPLYVPY